MNVHTFGRAAGMFSLFSFIKYFFQLRNCVHYNFALERMIIQHCGIVIEKMIIFVAIF